MTRLRPHSEGIPVPQATKLTLPFWTGCASGSLYFQRCVSCQAPWFARHLCGSCGSTELAWVQSEGVGTVYSYTIIWRAPSPGFSVPYAPAIVELDEGFQLVANVIGCEDTQLHVGQPVRAEFYPIGQGYYLPYFSPSGRESAGVGFRR